MVGFSLVTVEGVEINVARSSHLSIFKHDFFILVPPIMKDLIEIDNLEGNTFSFSDVWSFFVPVGDCCWL